MGKLKGFQKKYLRSLAHRLKPVVLVGQKGFSDELVKSTDQALAKHELIKVKFNEFKEKDEKAEISKRIEQETGSAIIGAIGHTIILYRQQRDPEKRKIVLPQKK